MSVKPVTLFKKGDLHYHPSGIAYNPAYEEAFGGKYYLTTAEGIEYEIDASSGDLIAVTDTNGNKLTYSEGGIFSDTGVGITFERDNLGRIVGVVDPEGNKIKYEYDREGDLVGVIDRSGNRTGFEYDEERKHYLTEIIDPLGRSGVRSEYDEEGRLKRIIDVNGNPIELTYDTDNSTQTVKDTYGNDTFYVYDSFGNVIQQIDPSGAVTILKYEDPSNPLLVTQIIDDNGNVVDYTYDSEGNLESRTALYNPNENDSPETTYYEYNQYGQMTSIVLPTGTTFEMDYDSKGNLLAMIDGDGTVIQSYKYDQYGRVLEESDPFGTTSYDNPDTNNDFDIFGNPYWMRDANGDITTMTYTSRGLLETMTDSEGTSTFTYDSRGREVRADYGDGIWVEYGYGAESDWTSLSAPTIGHIERKFTDDGRLGGWITPDGGELTFTYDEGGRLQKETTPDGQVTRYEYDDVNRINRVIDETTGVVSETVYDNVGRVDHRTIIVGEGTPEEERYTTSYTYYDDGRVKTTTDPKGNTWTYEYTLFTTTVIDPLGRRTTTVQTENYLPQEIRYADGSTSSSEYLFDNNLLEGSDYPTRIIDQGGNDRIYTYDDFGRLESATDLGDNTFFYRYRPNEEDSAALNDFLSHYDFASTDTGIDFYVENAQGDTILAYDYNDDGELGRVVYEDGSQTSFTYGADNREVTTDSGTQTGSDNRLESVTLPDGVEIRYTYNDSGQEEKRDYYNPDGDLIETVTTVWEEGRVTSVTDNAGTTTHTYAPDTGALSQVDTPTGGIIRYDYDDLGRVERLIVQTSADGEESITQYGYDAVGNLTTVIDPLGGETVMTYDGVNRLETRTLPNGVVTTYTYQENTDWVESIVHTDSSGGILASVTYGRNADGTPHTI
ncbi:MAG: RHS repeat protein, partial [Kamptonema sp. SIO1D9]|nr:RHS repeat protein [Kamptonema sp. SIO1D9]